MLRILRVFLLSVFCILILVFVGYLIYLLNGKSSWLAWKAEREALGERFEWVALVPPAVPDEDNFAMAPLVAGAVKGKNIEPRFSALKLPSVGHPSEGNWREGRRADLSAYAKALGKDDILSALQTLAPALDELSKASERQGNRTSADYAKWETEGLIGFRGAARVLRLRALLRLEKGDTKGAFDDVSTCIRIAEHLKAEPSLLALLLRTALLGIAIQPVWEGLIDHRWSPAQLDSLQTLIGEIDLLSSARLAFEAERLHGIESLLSVVEDRPGPSALTPEQNQTREKLRSSNHLFAALYRGWVYRNVLELARFQTGTLIEVFPRNERRVWPLKGTARDQFEKFERRHRDLILARIAIPALLDQTARISRLQDSLDQATVACALERFRIAKGSYPSRLDELVPAFLTKAPMDLVSGLPLNYQRDAGGSYLLWGVGWDGTDQHGALAWTKETPPALDSMNGDWPWFAVPAKR